MRHLICFGNSLHGDDGFGPAVYRRLSATSLPPQWRLFEAATRGLDALVLFDGCDEAVLVDACAPAGQPGRLHQPSPSEIGESWVGSGHGEGVGYLIRALSALDQIPPTLRILAAEMAALSPFQPGLSGPMAGAVDEAEALLRGWLGISDDD